MPRRVEVDGLSGKVEAVSAQNQRLNGLIDQQIAGLDTSSRRLFDEKQKQKQLDELRAQFATATDDNQGLKSTVDALRGAAVESPAVRLPDARVVAVNTNDKKVFLDIGRNHGLSLGMAFNVFDADDLVKISDAQAQGKAIAELIGADSDKSVGRIVSRNARARIDEGDVLVNVVYAPTNLLVPRVWPVRPELRGNAGYPRPRTCRDHCDPLGQRVGRRVEFRR